MMQYTLPPGTSQLQQTGCLTFKLTPVYLNNPSSSIKYNLKMWGFTHTIPMQPSTIIQKHENEHYSSQFGITTNLHGITKYFTDMGVMMIILTDERTQKQIGIGFIKFKTYIINHVLSTFNEQIEIVSTNNQKNKRNVIGQVQLKLQFDIPVNVPPTNRTRMHSLAFMLPNNDSDVVKQEAMDEGVQTRKQVQRSRKNIKSYHNSKSLKRMDSNNTSMRKLIVNPHVFQDSNDQVGKQFTIINNQSMRHKCDQTQRDHLGGQILAELKTKNKINKNILDFVEQDSIQNYPNLTDLRQKYGYNNVKVEEMKLKLDQVKYLNPSKQMADLQRQKQRNANNKQQDKGYIVSVQNIRHFVSVNSGFIDLQFCAYINEREQRYFYNTFIKQLKDFGVLIRNLQIGNVLQLQNKHYKGRITLKKANFDGDFIKLHLKRKDNNKKVGEIEMSLQKLTKIKNNEIPNTNPNIKNNTKQQKIKYNCYISVFPLFINPQANSLLISLHPQTHQQPSKSKKIIFQSNLPQKVTIQIEYQHNIDQFFVVIDPTIPMKDLQVNTKHGKVKVFMACADTIENLMKIVIPNDYPYKEQANEVGKRTNQQSYNNSPLTPHSPSSKQIVNEYSRSQKLSLIFQCFLSLLYSNNSECMQLIKKLLSPTVTYEQQTDLFERMCTAVQLSNPQAVTHLSFKDLLHGEFSMFWTCFQQYKKLNENYNKSLVKVLKEVRISFATCIGSNVKKQLLKMFEKILDKIENHRQILFGLIPKQICQSLILDYLTNRFNPENSILKNNSQNPIKNQSIVSNISSLNFSITNLIILLCRYTGSDGVTYCIKVSELRFLLLNMFSSFKLDINELQVANLVEYNKNQTQLLYEVVGSCCQSQISDLSHRFYNLIKSVQGLLLESTENITQNLMTQNQIQTQQNDHVHIRTQDIRIRTQEIGESLLNQQKNKNKKLINKPKKQITFSIEKLILQQSYFEDTQKFTLQIIDQKQQQIYRLQWNQLPSSLHLHQSQDYKINVIFQNTSNILQGVFIAQKNTTKILLYISSKGQYKQIGYIKTTNQPQIQSNQQQDDVIILEFKKQIEIPNPNINANIHQTLISKQIQEKQRQNLTLQPIKTQLKSQYILINIMSMSPAIRSSQQVILAISGQQKILKLSNTTCQYKIFNTQQKYLNIEIERQNREKACQKIEKIKGIQQVCFNNRDGSVLSVMKIELSEYLGELVMEEETKSKRIIFLNIYHMESFMSVDQDQGSKYNLIISNSNQGNQAVFVQQFVIANHPIEQSTIRTLWIGIHAQVEMNRKYYISIYKKNNHRLKNRENEDELIANFEMKMAFHNQTGIFENKGYLIDQKGYRLAINALQINYNDVFSGDAIGRKKFESLLTIFTPQSILSIWQSNPKTQQQLKSLIRSQYGYNNTQLHLIFELQNYQNQLLNLFINWDPNVLSNQSINLQKYTIKDLFSQYEIYDFTNSGLIPLTKAQLVHKLVFNPKSKRKNESENNNQDQRIEMQKFLGNGRDGWVFDLKSRETDGEIDYLFVLWCLRKFACLDQFFTFGTEKLPQRKNKKIIDQTTNNHTKIPQGDSISKIKSVKVELLEYRNIRVDNQPSTLVFYINGQKVAQPVPRCFTHSYDNPKKIITKWPIILEIYNKKYGVRELYNEELVQTLKIYEEKTQVLGGELIFQIEQDKDRHGSLSKDNENRLGLDSFSKIEQPGNTTINQFRQSRRQKWQNLKQSRQNTQKIQDVLKSSIKA